MTQAAGRLSVTAAELVRQFGRWQDKVATEPLFVTHHGRDRLVMLSMIKYRALLDGERNGHLLVDDDPRLETLIDMIAEGFVALDERLNIIAVNPVACLYLKGNRQALVGVGLADLYPGIAHSLLETYLARAIRSGETGAFDAPSFAHAGDWLHLRTFPLGAGAALLFRNISDEVNARQQTAAAEAAAVAAAANGRVGHGWLTPRGTFLRVDEALSAMAGFDPAALQGVRLTDILPVARRVEASEHLETVLRGGAPCAFDTELLVNRGAELGVRIGLADLHGDYASAGAVAIVTPL